ncbi:glycerol-3-phosphate responsive antiterminator [Bacillus solimangrovi]|uniref:Glycerol uptake operon antiterminator regulatory protein n=1 Tax=Bacillus solimangrovi TaxID=1305675 RepID=A0A1E5LJT2_9BACI|nr:glycerol-3-phosphate responsive antiterminator [Bacillus solimangrovi]OEH94353.1 glycerol-3-phosphate responsive antiterminator GlpP [Bacillus solimangrovi]
MSFQNQTILPSVRNMKEFDQLLSSDYEYLVLLDSHVGQVKNIVETAKKYNKKMFLHVDLIQGLKNDEFATEYLCQHVKPAGLISTRANVIMTAKKKGVYAVQRLFLLDTNALEKSYRLIEKTQPDFIEVMPGIIPHMIAEVKERTNIQIFAGGLIRSQEEVNAALASGAIAVTTSMQDFWK